MWSFQYLEEAAVTAYPGWRERDRGQPVPIIPHYPEAKSGLRFYPVSFQLFMRRAGFYSVKVLRLLHWE